MGQILLVRHGQASWDAEDYDVLSETGWEQSRVLGRAWAARGFWVDRVLMGSMRRHRETAEACVGELSGAPAPVVDAGWDEYDHVSMLARHPSPFGDRSPTKAEFQAWFEEATDRWTGGEHDDYDESYAAFRARVDGALDRIDREGTTVVFTSGGPVARVAARLLGADVAVWRRMNRVIANSGVTKVVGGRRGLTLVTLNEHVHLEEHSGLLTYR